MCKTLSVPGAGLETEDAPPANKRGLIGRRHARPIVAVLLSILTLSTLAWATPQWPAAARIALGVFALSIVAWSVLRLDETPVALMGGLLLIGLGVTRTDAFYASLGDPLIWLVIGASLLAAVLRQSGLAERLALRALRGAGTVGSLMGRLTWVIAATAFVVPSTSARAALLLPIFLVLARAIGDARVTRALALLFPTVILLSAGASLLGAGAHLVALDFMRRGGHEAPGFVGWFWLAAPFALASCVVATALIGSLFLDRGERSRPIRLPDTQATVKTARETSQQRAVAVITLAAIAGWCTAHWHGVDASVIALLAALAATCKPLTGVDLKAALKKVEWNLVLFLAATLVLGQALLDSGAAKLLADSLMRAVPVAGFSAAGVTALACVVALLSHLVVTSRTARALILVPTVALPLAATGLNPAALILLTVLGSGFCQTLSVSAKPVALFAVADVPTFHDADLLRLSLALFVPVALLLFGAAFFVWPLQGLRLVA